ncbi:MAG TPA: ATP-binding protein [Candidatus Limnocylindrales bacterium]|nr:ATP-binding protein [Candidatus Limnocylindrales bacterium]
MTNAGDHASTTTIDAAPERLADLRAFVRAELRERDVDEETISDLIQAVDELGCNTIEHGYAGRPGTIEVEVARGGTTVRVRMRDAAPAFDPRTVPEPRLDLPLRERPLGGMGVHLARTLTDRIDHRILPEGGNEIVLTKELRPSEPPEESDGHHDGPAHS